MNFPLWRESRIHFAYIYFYAFQLNNTMTLECKFNYLFLLQFLRSKYQNPIHGACKGNGTFLSTDELAEIFLAPE